MAQLTEKEMAHKVILALEFAQHDAMSNLQRDHDNKEDGSWRAYTENRLGEWNQTLAWAKQKLGVK